MTQETLDQLPDDALVARVREGVTQAYSVLYERHYDRALAFARRLAAAHEAQDVVQEAFVGVLNAIQKGGGPRDGFIAYLLRSVRNELTDRARRDHEVAVDDDALVGAAAAAAPQPAPEERLLDRGMVVAAFGSLPERWQEVLWLTEVEGHAPAALSERFRQSPSAIAQLSRRAREGLKAAWLQAHVGSVSADCRPVAALLGAYARGRLSQERRARVEGHLESCADCRQVLAELRREATNLRGFILIAALGSPALLSRVATASAGSSADVALQQGLQAQGVSAPPEATAVVAPGDGGAVAAGAGGQGTAGNAGAGGQGTAGAGGQGTAGAAGGSAGSTGSHPGGSGAGVAEGGLATAGAGGAGRVLAGAGSSARRIGVLGGTAVTLVAAAVAAALVLSRPSEPPSAPAPGSSVQAEGPASPDPSIAPDPAVSDPEVPATDPEVPVLNPEVPVLAAGAGAQTLLARSAATALAPREVVALPAGRGGPPPASEDPAGPPSGLPSGPPVEGPPTGGPGPPPDPEEPEPEQPDPPVMTGPASCEVIVPPIVTGTAEPGAAVRLLADGTSVATATADGSGVWEVVPELPGEAGEVTYTAMQEVDGLESEPSEPATCTYLAPEIRSTEILDDLLVVKLAGIEPGLDYELTVDGESLGPADGGSEPEREHAISIADWDPGIYVIGVRYVGGALRTEPITVP